MFKSSIKREIRHFHVVFVQRLQRNVQKSVMNVQSCCFVNLTYCFFAFLVAVSVLFASLFFPNKQGPHTSSPLPRTLLHKTQRGPLDATKNTDKCIIDSQF